MPTYRELMYIKKSLNFDLEKNLPNVLMSLKLIFSVGIFYE